MAASSGVLPEVTDGERAFVEHILSSTEQSILYAVWVNKIKNKNYDRRLLVLTPYQLMTLKTKRIGDSLTVARVGHWFDIQKLTCLETRADLSEIQTEFGGFSFACVLPTVRAHQVVGVAQRAIHDVTCNWPRAYEFSVGRIERGQVVDVDLATELPALPLGGFVQTYLAAVVHANMAIPDHRDILDFIVKHSSGRAVELHGPRDELQRMDQKSSNSVSYEPIGTALASNNFYEVFSMSDIHGPEVVEVLASALTTNTTLSVLEIRNVGATRGFDSLGTAIADNPGCRLTTLTLANNMIKDKAALKLARGLATLGIEFLDLSECSLSPKGLASLARSVAVSETLPQSLRFLNLSKNRFNQSSTTAIAGWIHSLKALEELVLASCSVDVSELSIVFPESACSALATVDLSANAISDQDAVKLSRALTRSRCSTLDLSECRASLQSIAGVFGTMTSTTRAEGACLIANGIRVATEDASRLSWAFSHGECLDTVSLTNCQLGVVGLCTIMDGLLKCPHLRRMGLSGNIRTKEKGIDEVVARLVEVVNERPIEVLELQGSSKSRFGTHLIPFFYCLQHNTTLRQLDISGNHVGDDGVSALAEVLQYTALEFLSIDENQPSLVGIRSFAAGVAQSRSIVDLPIPNSDYKHLMKASRDNQDLKTELNSIIKTMRMQVAHNANKVQDGDARMAELIGNMTDEEWLEADKIQRRERRRIRKVMRQEAARAENLQRTQRANKRKTIIMPRKTSTYGTRPGSHYAGVSLRQASMLTPVGNNNSNPVISSTHRERSHIRDVYDLFDTAAEMLNASDSDETDDGAGFGSSNDDGGAPGTSGSEPLVPGPVDGLPEATDDDEVSSVSAASTPVGVGGSDGSDDAFPAAAPELVAPPDLPPPMESLLRSIGS